MGFIKGLLGGCFAESHAGAMVRAMGTFMQQLEIWEDDGGSDGVPGFQLVGSAAQLEWAGRIRRLVNAEFSRVAASFRAVAKGQLGAARAETEAILQILEEKRGEVMSRTEAGYLIHDWQEISDQVRQLIRRDVRYGAIVAQRAARKLT